MRELRLFGLIKVERRRGVALANFLSRAIAISWRRSKLCSNVVIRIARDQNLLFLSLSIENPLTRAAARSYGRKRVF